ncbi:maturation protein [ssRNA phage Gerhypos.4_20]|uniref:Maturation protein n=2 Tax=Leviviricetes TaxID=2842243 RepID=A0A8S5L2A0_9VIRU|nr:maturation protein [ssRNA phage Gerhypos.4_20]QDH89168.1 MAG: hypothetical protein H4Bulk46500_000003 [Leviviridae sp.]DAD51258.1 TPA_asm: maturation protein [ssRNA phage Gerhypos.4_20]
MTRSRVLSTTVYGGTEYLDGSAPSIKNLRTDFVQEDLINGEAGHYGYPRFNLPNVGGDFFLRKFTRSNPLVNVGEIWRGGVLNQRYVGSIQAADPPFGYVGGDTWTPIDSGMGSLAYNRMKPTKPNMQALNAIYELKDLPGMLRQRFLNTKAPLKSMSNYYLALKFGWGPLLSDIRNFVLTHINAQKRLEQLLRDNGRPVRRKVILSDTSTTGAATTGTSFPAILPTFVTQYYTAAPVYLQRLTDSDRVWATARFRYWLPEGPRDVNWTTAMKAKIFGLQPTPSAVYRALPWTWLGDWFLNVGNMLENMEAGVADRLAADYFYVMHQRELHNTNDVVVGFQKRDGTKVNFQASSYSNMVHKKRIMGDPFGFATAQNVLSGTQLSILGALGMSKVR